jgi:prevent-host-death family protein
MSDHISKSEFKAKALEVLRDIEKSGNPVIVTDHGKPAIEVRRYSEKKHDPLAILKGSVTEYHEPTEPVAAEEWELNE